LMPLKEPDLKDTDTYKKASRQDLSKVAAGNAKFWIFKDVELLNTSGKKQKYPAFLALVDDNGIRKAMAGKKLICKGTCGMKEERIAFEPSTGTVPYKILKVSIPLLLGKAVWIPTGQEEAAEEEEEEESEETASSAPTPPTAPPPPKPQPAGTPVISAASLTGAWNQLVKDVQAHLAAHPERKADLMRELTEIGALLKANQAAEAKPKMDRLQSALEAPPPAPPGGAAGQTQVTARWSALVKQLQAAVAAHPEKKAELVHVSAGIPDLIRAGKLDLAAKQLDAVEQALQEKPREKEYRARYQAVQSRWAAALQDPARDASRLRAMNAFIVEKANAGDFETALKALLKLEEALAIKPAATATTPQPKQKSEEEAEEGGDEEEEDEEEQKEAAEFQKDLKGRMIAAMAQVKTRAPREGEKPKPQLQFMVYLAAKSSVIVAKKVANATKKLVKEIADVSGGKILRGECIFEKGAHTFVLENVPGGLAKKLAGALLAETNIRYKVRVRTADSSVTLDDETDVDAESGSPEEKSGTANERSPGMVAKRIFLLERWQKIPPQVSANLKALQEAIARELPEEDAGHLISLAEDYLDDFYEEMKDAIDDDINSGDAQYKSAIAAIHAFREKIASEPLIQHLKSNPLGAPVDIESILLGALSEVEKTLAS
jgi:hypothetical protein